MIFRELNQAEAVEFIDWANDNYKPGEDIDRDLWHPVVVRQCDRINQRAARYKAETPQHITGAGR